MKTVKNGLIILSLSVFGITLSVEQPKKCLPFIVGGQQVPLVYIKATDDPSKGGCCLQGNVYYANANNGEGQCCNAGTMPDAGGGCCPLGQIYSPDKKGCCIQGKGCCPAGTHWSQPYPNSPGGCCRAGCTFNPAAGFCVGAC